MTTAPITPEDGQAALSEVVATRIRGLMAEKRLTQLDVSQTLNVSRSGVSDRLNGVKPINLNELPALARLMETSIDYLLGLTNDRSPRNRITPGGGSMFVTPERTSGISAALRACRDSNPKPSDLVRVVRRLIAMLGHLVSGGDRNAVVVPAPVRGGEAAGAVIIELPVTRETLGRIQAGEWPDDYEPTERQQTARRSHLTVVP